MGENFDKMNPFKKRTKLEIVKDIMTVIKDNNNLISPTKLMRLSNLSFQMFEEYLAELEKKEFVKIENLKGKRNVYSLTDKGFSFLSKFKEFKTFLDEFGF